MHTLFISDLHLSPNRPDITSSFIHFMREEAPNADALYVLGDLFDFWIGDDDPTPFAQQIKAEFRRLTQQGVPCYFTQGNRDFLVGKTFAQETGIQLLPEEAVINLYGQKAVILHGDTLCTQDTRYLAFRAKVHQPWLQRLFGCLPFSLRQRIVRKVQTDIRDEKQHKSMIIMDVTPNEVLKVMQYHQVDLMIHGHTHRPAIHPIMDDALTPKTRIVLGDWYSQSSVLVYSKLTGYELLSKSLSQND
ncbi:UDP-2,3-diacylglucosamine diphosphatase [Vibrio metoecus]|uniref:UDP-2,3-diacylglucosamine diphosphatase n=1 Tax=Vibrio metoecus TaxID=1481663 RepID=UPI000BA9309A|nr:UDP-2,3-diacylglucosamine diphosphatase [Vibrio metoecus]PAR38092.1 UDP-2,3-diacylglucosamine diphosphatase [Vibrio metoecus]